MANRRCNHGTVAFGNINPTVRLATADHSGFINQLECDINEPPTPITGQNQSIFSVIFSVSVHIVCAARITTQNRNFLTNLSYNNKSISCHRINDQIIAFCTHFKNYSIIHQKKNNTYMRQPLANNRISFFSSILETDKRN